MSSPSPEVVNEMDRMEMLRAWLNTQLPGQSIDLVSASSDASFRRYFRVGGNHGKTVIAMDAPPALENCAPFIHVAGLLHDAGVNLPEILGQDAANGFLLLSDLGKTTYLDALQPLRGEAGSRSQIDALYRDAIRSLVIIQLASREGQLPDYDRALLERELGLFPEWYVQSQLGVILDADQARIMASTFDALLDNNIAQARVFVHRDYHSRNLMVCNPNPGILDFQDAVLGPISYDLVSLLRDAYIEWEEERVIDWCVHYWEMARARGLPVPADFAAFYRDFEWMGAQRQIKVLGIFARLAIRDGKTAYLRDQALVLKYLRGTCRRYRELSAFAKLLDELGARNTQPA